MSHLLRTNIPNKYQPSQLPHLDNQLDSNDFDPQARLDKLMKEKIFLN